MRLRTLLALLPALTLALAGCGSEATPVLQSEAVVTETAETESVAEADTRAVDRNPPPALASGDDATFATALGSVAAYGTGRFELVVVDDAGSDEAPLTVEVSGIYDNVISASQVTVDMESLLADSEGVGLPGMEAYVGEPLVAVAIADEIWIQWALLSVLTGTPEAWITTDITAAAAQSSELGIVSGFGDPTSALDELATADVVVEELDTEVLRGVTVRHWSTTLDFDAFVAQLDPAGQADLETALASIVSGVVTVELWVGDADGLLYRYRLADVPTEDDSGPVSSVTVDLFDHGQPLTIERPPAELVVDGSILWG